MVGDELFKILDESITALKEKSVVVIASNVVSICEGNVVKIGERDKEELIKEEAEYHLPPHNTYHIILAIKNSIIIPSAGIDESNTNGYYTLWPMDAQKTANKVSAYLKKRFGVKYVGVVIADSKTTPLRWGVTGVAIAHSGFAALNDYTGKPDLFGRKFMYEKANVADALAAYAVVVMGEGAEQTPVAVVEDVPFVEFQDRNPTGEEIEMLKISMDEDVYGEILRSVKWRKGRR